jgi:hypothetical protein
MQKPKNKATKRKRKKRGSKLKSNKQAHILALPE